MIKSRLIAGIAAKMTHLSEQQINAGVNRTLEFMTEALIRDQRIEIRGFGSFTPHERPPRKAHNPKTGEKVITRKARTAHFRPGKELRERVNASRETVTLDDQDLQQISKSGQV